MKPDPRLYTLGTASFYLGLSTVCLNADGVHVCLVYHAPYAWLRLHGARKWGKTDVQVYTIQGAFP